MFIRPAASSSIYDSDGAPEPDDLEEDWDALWPWPKPGNPPYEPHSWASEPTLAEVFEPQ